MKTTTKRMWVRLTAKDGDVKATARRMYGEDTKVRKIERLARIPGFPGHSNWSVLIDLPMC